MEEVRRKLEKNESMASNGVGVVDVGAIRVVY